MLKKAWIPQEEKIHEVSEDDLPPAAKKILLLEDDQETIRVAQRVLGPEGEGYQLRHVRDRVAAQLLMRRSAFAVVMLPIDTAEQEAFYHSLKGHTAATTRFVGMLTIEEESHLDRLDTLELDGVLHRPISDADLRATVRQLIGETVATVT